MIPRLSDVLTKAASYLGVTEQPPYSNRTTLQVECDSVWWLGFSRNGIAWCGTAVDLWVGRDVLAASCFSTPYGATKYQQAGRWRRDPEVGSVAFMTFQLSGGITHVGLVTGINADGSVETIEGNTSLTGSQDNGGSVLRRHRYRSVIVGFGHNDYAPETHEEIPMFFTRPFGYDDVYLVGAGDPRKLPNMIGVNELVVAGVVKPILIIHDMATFRALTGFDPATGTPNGGV